MSPDTMTIDANWPVKWGFAPPAKRMFRLTKFIKIFMDARCTVLERVHCDSLAGVLFGHNGRLIVSQGEYDAALAKLRDTLAAVATVPPFSEWKLWRLDIACNFDLRARPLIMAHEFVRVPGIRKAPTLFDDGHGLSYCGSGSRFVVKFYDKARKMRVRDSSVLRSEVSLCGKHLRRHLPGCEWLKLNALYRVFREIMVGIPPIPKPKPAKKWPEALAVFSREVRIQFLACLEPYTSKRTFRRNRARVEAAARSSTLETFSWASLLPPDVPPPAVHVYPKNRNPSQNK